MSRRRWVLADGLRCGQRAARRQGPLGALPDQAALEIRPARRTCEKPAALARSSCRVLQSGCELRYASTTGFPTSVKG